MLFVLIVSHLLVLASANPFHKYPYVFLLDIGNEELEKTNSEQIRVSIPGGSLALRYPAVGDGDLITHVRVSGIDFGTDLKANIVDGGPGYKYVVLVFMGNTGVPYDAVVTIQTVSNDNSVLNNNGISINSVESTSKDKNSYEVSEDDPNDSSEDLDTLDEDNKINQNSKAESTQASSSYYKYAHEEKVNTDYNDDGNDDYSGYQRNPIEQEDKRIESDDEENEIDGSSSNENINSPETEYNLNSDTVQKENNDEESQSVNNVDYSRYKFLRPYVYDGVRVYPQQAIQYIPQGNSKDAFFADSQDNAQDMNEEEIRNEASNYRDNNNNNYDSDDNSAVAS